MTVPIPGNNSGAVGAVLPPIVTGNSTNANNNPAVNPKYMFTDGNRNANSNVVASRAPVVQMTPVIPVQQKKKKKVLYCFNNNNCHHYFKFLLL